MNLNSLQALARNGDTSAENKLFTMLSVRFRLFVQRKIWDETDADEVVQEALMAVAKKHRETDFQLSFVAWAHQVLEYEILRYYRRKGYRERRFGQVVDADAAAAWIPDPDLKRRLLDCLGKIDRVNNRYARMLNLHYQGFSTAEVCAKLKLTANNSYVLLSRAREMLELCLSTGVVA